MVLRACTWAAPSKDQRGTNLRVLMTKRIRASPRSTNATFADPKPYGTGERTQHSSGACHPLVKCMPLHRTKGGMHLIRDCTCRTNNDICAGARWCFSPQRDQIESNSKSKIGEITRQTTGDKTARFTRQVQVDWQSHLHTWTLARLPNREQACVIV
jgi:hypothetical protein